MNTKTKYDIDDEVYYFGVYRLNKNKIKGIYSNTIKDESTNKINQDITYFLENEDDIGFKEEDLFEKTKDLYHSLNGDIKVLNKDKE